MLEQLVELHRTDILSSFRGKLTTAHLHLDGDLPETPGFGALDVDELLDATFAFS